jgi:hypothetical protein
MPSLVGLPEVPCVRCHERVGGLAWGDRCPKCHADRKRRASLLARRISLVAALIAAGLLGWRFPAGPNSRKWIGIGTLMTFFLVRNIAFRLAMEFLPD